MTVKDNHVHHLDIDRMLNEGGGIHMFHFVEEDHHEEDNVHLIDVDRMVNEGGSIHMLQELSDDTDDSPDQKRAS